MAVIVIALIAAYWAVSVASALYLLTEDGDVEGTGIALSVVFGPVLGIWAIPAAVFTRLGLVVRKRK